MLVLPEISITVFLRSVFIALMLAFAFSINAQLCTGSLGDPVVNVTFGGGGTNSGYTATNAYQYTSSSCPNDGFYTITTSTANCFGNTWHTVASDHTGNGGAFMLVNATYTPGDFLVTAVDNLCPNTTYEFAAWIMNVINRFGSIKPNITFSIETSTGTVLQQFSTGDIPESGSPVWKQYGFYFATPANNIGIVLRMTNNAPGGIGNDIALDDITFRPCGPVITSSILNNPDTVHICEGNTNLYTVTSNVSSAYISPVYQWQVSTDAGSTWKDIPGANSITWLRSSTGAGIYWYRLAVNEQSSVGITACRIASNYVVINVHSKPVVDAGADRIIFNGENANLQGKVTGEAPVIYWDPPDNLSSTTVLDPIASPSSEKKYSLHATSAFGCKNEDEMIVKVVAGIFVPTAFTPNNDGKNDKWRIPFLDPMLGATVSVYNRYGQLIYQVESKVVEWDGTFNGKLQATGTFVYHIGFRNGRKDMKGVFTLIR
jgi:gliding motility-associated-like protein